MDIEDTAINIRTTRDYHYERQSILKNQYNSTNFYQQPQPSEDDIVFDARRCIYCSDAACTKCSPTSTDIKEYVHAARSRNWYYAAKIILSSNPIPLSTSQLSDLESTSMGGCYLKNTLYGAIHTNTIQTYCIRRFRDYNIKQKVPPSNEHKVAIIGSGPSGMSCAAFLRRFGIEVTIFEKEQFSGGFVTSEVLPFRVPKEDTDYEYQLLKDINVIFQFNKKFGVDFTVDSLFDDGFECIYIAIGKPDEAKIPFEAAGAISGRNFLRELNETLKFNKKQTTPDFKGKTVCIIGSGPTAFECASASIRLGGDVTIVSSEPLKNIKSSQKVINELFQRECEFLTNAKVVSVNNGEVKILLKKQEINYNFDHVIIATEGVLNESLSLIPGQINGQKVEGYDNIFVGGRIIDSMSVEESVNDGKVAARMIADRLGFKSIEIPFFTTAVDEVSLETTVCGVKFINPVGLASAESSGTYECIRNSFLSGMGYCITRTILLTKDLLRDTDMRIVKCDDNPYGQLSFMNIAMLSEHPFEYWLDIIKRLKKEFPDRVIIASISATDKKEDWQKLVKGLQDAGADMFELNLSCPNEAHGEEDQSHSANKIGLALGASSESVKKISQYVKEVTKVPFFIKLTPNVTEPEELARGSFEGGASGVSMINTILGITRFYPDATPCPQIGPEKVVLAGGLSGEMIRPVALRQITKVHQKYPEKPIIALGGIWNSDNALQMIYAGANCVAFWSASIRFSFEITREILAGLRFYLFSWSRPDLRSLLSHHISEMSTMPYQVPLSNVQTQDRPVPSLLDLRGIGAKKVVERRNLPENWTLNVKIDRNTCLNCGKCAFTCRDTGNNAIHKDSDGKWAVDVDKCVGCGGCVSCCPVQAMKFEESQKEKIWHWQEEYNLYTKH